MDKMSHKYRYFVSYTYFCNGKSGSGNFHHERDDKFEHIQQLVSLARSYEKQAGYEENSLVIMNYFIMKEQEQKEETVFDKIKNILRGKKH